MGTESLHADRWTETHDKANSIYTMYVCNRYLVQCYRVHYIIKLFIKKGINK